MTEANKKIAINATLFVGPLVLGALIGWGAWELNHPPRVMATPVREADAAPVARPAVPAKPAPAVQPVVAVTPPAPVAAPVAPAPAAAPNRQQFQNLRNASPEEQQAAIQNFAQNMSQWSQDPRVQQLAAQAQTPEGQAQLREQANALLQQFRNGQGGQGIGGRNFGGQRQAAAPGGINPANPALPANVAAVEEDAADGG